MCLYDGSKLCAILKQKSYLEQLRKQMLEDLAKLREKMRGDKKNAHVSQ